MITGIIHCVYFAILLIIAFIVAFSNIPDVSKISIVLLCNLLALIGAWFIR